MPWNRQEEKQFENKNKIRLTKVRNGIGWGIEKFRCDEYFYQFRFMFAFSAEISSRFIHYYVSDVRLFFTKFTRIFDHVRTKKRISVSQNDIIGLSSIICIALIKPNEMSWEIIIIYFIKYFVVSLFRHFSPWIYHINWYTCQIQVQICPKRKKSHQKLWEFLFDCVVGLFGVASILIIYIKLF